MSDEMLPGGSGEEQEEYERDILELEDESGEVHSFEVLDAADIGGNRYLAMVPFNNDPAGALAQDAEMVIMRLEEVEGEEVLDVVEDEEELLSVVSVFVNRLQELYDIDLSEFGLEG